jgi:hypothetical protein
MASLAGVFGCVLLAAADGGVARPLAVPPAAELWGASPRPAPALMDRPLVGPITPPERSYELRPAKDGTSDLVYQAPGFTARIARDGTARFDQAGHLPHGWALFPFFPYPMPAGTPSVQSTVRDLIGKRRGGRSRRGAPPPDDPRDPPLPIPLTSRYRPDPREACTASSGCLLELKPLLMSVTGSFDLTDEVLLMDGQDPYRREKALFLTATRELRAGMAARALATNLRRAQVELEVQLRTVACDARRSPAERRAVLEALRAELDGDTPQARDAAAQVTRFLASHFAADGGAPCEAH